MTSSGRYAYAREILSKKATKNLYVFYVLHFSLLRYAYPQGLNKLLQG